MTHYVATLAQYVLVEAENEEQARERGQAALEELYAELRGAPPQRASRDSHAQMSDWPLSRPRGPTPGPRVTVGRPVQRERRNSRRADRSVERPRIPDRVFKQRILG